MTAAELFASELRRRGFDWMATLCGHGLDPLFHAARNAGLRLIDTRNEQTAAYIADAYGRLTRRPGICAVSSGVAHVNALTGVANAWFDRAPMLLISGAAAASTAGMGHFQDLDQVTLARPITKFSRSIDCAGRTSQILDEALESAVTDPPGAVHLMFPMDVQNTEVAESAVTPPAPMRPKHVAPVADPSEFACALAKSKAPLVIAGSGVFYDGTSDAMLRFCEACHIPVVTPIWDRGSVDRPSPVFLGVIGAATGGREVLSQSDCIVMAGAEVDYRLGYLHGLRAGYQPAPRWDGVAPPDTVWKDWLAECVSLRDEFRAGVERRAEEQSRGELHALHIIRVIASVLADDPVLLIDGGSIGQWAHQLLCYDRYPSHWLTCGRSGVVGWGIGGAMAARLAFPRRPVILLSGDGAFTFNVADLESAARQRLPFVAIVADDQAWGITQTGHVRQFGAPIASSLGPIAFDRLAESLGASGVRVSTPEEIGRELRRAMREQVVTVIHAPIVGGNP